MSDQTQSETRTMHELRFKCGDCGETLEVARDGDFMSYDGYHACFGEHVGDVAIVKPNGVSRVREEIEIEVSLPHEF